MVAMETDIHGYHGDRHTRLPWRQVYTVIMETDIHGYHGDMKCHSRGFLVSIIIFSNSYTHTGFSQKSDNKIPRLFHDNLRCFPTFSEYFQFPRLHF